MATMIPPDWLVIAMAFVSVLCARTSVVDAAASALRHCRHLSTVFIASVTASPCRRIEIAAWLPVLEELTGVASLMGEEEFPALCRWRREYTVDEAVRACLPSQEQLVAYYAGKKDAFVIRGKSLQKQ